MREKVIFDAYDDFVARRINVKVISENCDVKPFTTTCNLWELRCYDKKLYGEVVLSMVRVIVIE